MHTSANSTTSLRSEVSKSQTPRRKTLFECTNPSRQLHTSFNSSISTLFEGRAIKTVSIAEIDNSSSAEKLSLHREKRTKMKKIYFKICQSCYIIARAIKLKLINKTYTWKVSIL